jgi:hypothetical protein
LWGKGKSNLHPQVGSGCCYSLLAPEISCSSSSSISTSTSRYSQLLSCHCYRVLPFLLVGPIRSMFRSHQLAIPVYLASQSGRVSSQILSSAMCQLTRCLYSHRPDRSALSSLTMLRCQSPHHLYCFSASYIAAILSPHHSLFSLGFTYMAPTPA